MAASPSLQAAHRGAPLRPRRGRPRLVGDDAARLAAGADRPGRCGARHRPARHPAGARALSPRSASCAHAGEEPATGPDRASRSLAGHYRDARCIADARSRLATAAATTPAVRRTAAAGSGRTTSPSRSLKGCDARPGRRVRARRDPAEHRRPFETLLVAATTHPAMLRYLDNAQSAGPHSRVVARSRRGARRGGPRRARHRHQREPGARGAGAAHARRRERARRRLHAGRRHRLRRGAERLARRPGTATPTAAASISPTGTSPAPRPCSAGATAKARTRCARCCATSRAIRRRRASSRPSWPAISSPTSRRRRWSTALAAVYLEQRRRPRARSTAS